MDQPNQTTDTILMVRPARFGYNPETAADNAFQVNDKGLDPQEISENARAEFDRFVQKLRDAGIDILVVEDTETPVKTDAVFPNNWISFHQDGRIVVYPMFSTIRRRERRLEIIDALRDKFEINELVNLAKYEDDGRFLESTGSMILDRKNRVAYACLSQRTDPGVLEEITTMLGYQPIVFTAFDQQGVEIYHTNVMLALGENIAIICAAVITDEKERKMVLNKLRESGKDVIEITYQQMMAFAGNMLEVRNRAGESFLVMSEQAFHSLSPEQIARIEKYDRILYSSLYTIETYGGGSARCMMAEVFLPRKGSADGA